MAGEGSSEGGNPVTSQPSTPLSPTSVGFNTDQLPPDTSQNYSDFDEGDEAAVEPEIIRDEPNDPLDAEEEEEEGEDLFQDNYLDDYRGMEEQDNYESVGLNDSYEDEKDLNQIMQDRMAAEKELDARDVRATDRRLPELLHDDIVDPVTDEMLAKFVVDSHFKSQAKGANLDDIPANNLEEDVDMSPNQTDLEIIPQDLLKKYITYAKLNVFPNLHDADLDKLTHVYAELRRESSHGQGVPIAVRHIESMIRMSEAHARMHLRQHVTQEDVDMAIRVLLGSFISTQNFGVQKALQKSFKKYMTFKKDYNDLLLHLLRGLVKDALHFEEIVSGSSAGLTHIDVKVNELQNKAQDYEIYDLKPFFTSNQFSRANFELDEERDIIRHRL